MMLGPTCKIHNGKQMGGIGLSCLKQLYGKPLKIGELKGISPTINYKCKEEYFFFSFGYGTPYTFTACAERKRV